MSKQGLRVDFDELDPEESFFGSPRTDFALDSELETLPRELVQNVYDARKQDQVPEVDFSLERLEGSELEEFKRAIDWGTLEPHLEAVAENDEKLGMQKALSRIRDGELYVLGVSDRNTVGLEGDETSRKTNYANLVKDFANSDKSEGGGIHGVGASVLWAFSGFKLVLFNSLPEGEDQSKLVGRLDLPDHELRGQEYAGGGWLGVDQSGSSHPVAMRDAPDDLTEKLRVDRPREDGTTALIVGFKEPTRETRSPEDIVDGLYETAARYYWPLIVDDEIEVTVEGPTDGAPRTVDPSTVDRVLPYVEAYESWEDPDDEFGDQGTVAVREVEFEVPPTDSEPAKTGSLVLVVRLARDDDLDKYRNKVAMFRGARHVVKYRNYGSVSRTTGRDFHALLLAGGAKHEAGLSAGDIPDDADRAVESFFRDAEPEAHDTWEKPTQKLANTYDDDNPSRRIVSFLKDDVKRALQQVLGSAETDDEERVDTFGSEFPFFQDDHGSGKPGPTPGPTPGPRSSFEPRIIERTYDRSRQHYRGTFDLDSGPAGPWSVTITIDEVDGSNKTIDQLDVLDGDSPEATDVSVDEGVVTYEFDATTTHASFEMWSVEVGDEVMDGQTRLDVEYDLSGGGSSV